MPTLREMIAADPSLLDAPVLGTLPRTADGAIIGRGATVFQIVDRFGVHPVFLDPLAHLGSGEMYHRREAAERAAGAKQ